jgi:TRAP-type C4-dicarboxylate transport system permease small subunit
MISALRRLHDRITTAGFAGAALCVAIITGAFWYEVVSRYFFSAPTTWAYDLASFVLCPMIFLAIPEMTRRRAHVAVSYLADGMPPHARARLTTAVLLAAALVCFAAAWIAGSETWRQYVRGVETITAVPIRKWWVSIFIPYGLMSSGLYFLRQFAGDTAVPLTEEEARS